MVLASCVLNNQGQLPGGKRSRTKNGSGHRCKNGVLDFLTHGSSSLLQHLQQKTIDCSQLPGLRLKSCGMRGAEAGG
jgi:hypothetical protein